MAAREAALERCGEEQPTAVCSWSLAHVPISGQLRVVLTEHLRGWGWGPGWGSERGIHRSLQADRVRRM